MKMVSVFMIFATLMALSPGETEAKSLGAKRYKLDRISGYYEEVLGRILSSKFPALSSDQVEQSIQMGKTLSKGGIMKIKTVGKYWEISVVLKGM